MIIGKVTVRRTIDDATGELGVSITSDPEDMDLVEVAGLLVYGLLTLVMEERDG